MSMVNFLKSLSIRNKMMFSSIATVLVPLTILGLMTYTMSTDIVIKKSINNSKGKISMIQKNITMINEFIKENINIISVDTEIQKILKAFANNPSEIERISMEDHLFEELYSKTFQTSWTEFSGLTDKNGIILAVTADIMYADLYSVIHKALKKISYTKQKTTYWTGLSELKYKNNQTRNMIAVFKPVYDIVEGDYIGNVFFFIDEETISSIYESGKESENAAYEIIDENGIVVSATKKQRLYKKQYVGNTDDRLLITNFKIDTPDWKIVYTIPIEEITSENETLTGAFVIISFISIIISILLAFVFSRMLSNPLNKLKIVMSKIKEGDYRVRVGDLGKDEIGEAGKVFNIMMEKLNGLIEETREKSVMIKKSELRLLQEQIKPHFLYNTIESILSLIHLGMFDKAAETTMKMGNFYRIALSTGHFMITLEEEIKLTESYLYIQKNRYVEYMDYEIICAKDVPNFLIPKLTLQPLVENAIYHGLRKKHVMGMIKVRIKNESGIILIDVYDNGAGMAPEKVSELMYNSETDVKSFGISSVRKRLEFVYGEGFQFTVQSEVGVCSVIRLTFDCKVLKGEAVND